MRHFCVVLYQEDFAGADGSCQQRIEPCLRVIDRIPGHRLLAAVGPAILREVNRLRPVDGSVTFREGEVEPDPVVVTSSATEQDRAFVTEEVVGEADAWLDRALERIAIPVRDVLRQINA